MNIWHNFALYLLTFLAFIIFVLALVSLFVFRRYQYDIDGAKKGLKISSLLFGICLIIGVLDLYVYDPSMAQELICILPAGLVSLVVFYFIQYTLLKMGQRILTKIPGPWNKDH
jgi:hypothetical protein